MQQMHYVPTETCRLRFIPERHVIWKIVRVAPAISKMLVV